MNLSVDVHRIVHLSDSLPAHSLPALMQAAFTPRTVRWTFAVKQELKPKIKQKETQ